MARPADEASSGRDAPPVPIADLHRRRDSLELNAEDAFATAADRSRANEARFAGEAIWARAFLARTLLAARVRRGDENA
jgi:hypothetical protein